MLFLAKMILKLIIFQLIALTSSETIVEKLKAIETPKEKVKNFTEFVQEWGFNAEEFEIVTEDGYVSKMFHIPGKKKPVLLVHGTFDCSNTWALRGNKSLAVALAREGYDVWAGNARGNRYARKHVTLNPDTDDAFWDFSLYEPGYFDWPAMIDRVLKETNETKLYGIGHSQAIASFLVLTSSRPEYNEKVELFIGLAPGVYLRHTGPLWRAVLEAAPIILPTLNVLGINELFANHSAEKLLIEYLCTQGLLSASVCTALLDILAGPDPDGLDPEFTKLLLSQFPTSVSRKTLEHYYQIFRSDKFAQFDYGSLNNLNVYGNTGVPEYDLNKVSTKVAFMYGENDQLITVKDSQHIAGQIPNLVYYKAIDKKEWNHLDFIWSSEMDKYLFGPIIELLDKYDW